MEPISEKIFAILDNHLACNPPYIIGMGIASQKVSSMIRELITWLMDEKNEIIIGTIFSETDDDPIEEVINYWLKNVSE